MVATNDGKTLRLRSVFISDVHLGSRNSRATELLRFLDSIDVDYLILVGDIVDLWSMRRSFYWPREHHDVLRAIWQKAREGTQVVYVPGNHDEEMREFCGSLLGNLQINRRYVHATADGRHLMVMHGDEFDAAVKCSPLLMRLGGFCYGLVMLAGRAISACRKMAGLPHWSLAAHVKLRLASAARYVEAFETAAARFALQRGLDGVVCGHIHRAAVREIDGVLYCNDGDWVESCTALVEDNQGALSLLHFGEAGLAESRAEIIEAAA